MKRICKKCGVEKDIEEFVPVKLCRYGRSYMCKKCKQKIKIESPGHKERKKKSYIRHRDKNIARQKRYNSRPGQDLRIKKYAEKYRNTEEFKKNIIIYREIYNNSDCYYKKLMAMRNNIKKENITPEMIELKRESMQFKRLTKELENVINSR